MGSPIHDRLCTALAAFFPSRCSIEVASETNDKGAISQDWRPLAGHGDLACRVMPAGGTEVRRSDMSYALSSHAILLAGHCPAIRPEMRAVVAGQVYDIQAVEHDGHGLLTRLRAQVLPV